jgi:hypothetical protein
VQAQAGRRKKKKARKLWGGIAAAVLLAGLGWLAIRSGWPVAAPAGMVITSVPSNARVFIDGKEQNKRTPCPLRRPGNGPHVVALKLDGFEPVTRKIMIGHKGQWDMDGVPQTGATVRCAFAVPVTVRSVPEQCSVTVNQERLRSLTPVEIKVVYGTLLDIRLVKSGWSASLPLRFGRDAVPEAADGRFWEIEPVGGKLKRYTVIGRLARQVEIKSVPENARLFLGQQLLGASNAGPLAMPCGTQQLVLNKDGFEPTLINVSIDSATPPQLGPFYLLRRVTVRLPDESGPAARGMVTAIDEGMEKNTVRAALPCTLALPSRKTVLTVQWEGGPERKVVVPPTIREYTVAPATASLSLLTVLLKDENYNPLREIAVWYVRSKASKTEELGSTDQEGKAEGMLAPGRYMIKVQEKGYQPVESAIDILPGNRNQFTFVLYPEN